MLLAPHIRPHRQHYRPASSLCCGALAWVVPLVYVLAFFAVSGCSKTRYRLQADNEVTGLIGEKSDDPRWAIPGFNINIDPRSRYYEVHNQDRIPLPPDDPKSHELMHAVAGKRGYRKWHQYGDQPQWEAPEWQQLLGASVPLTADGSVKLDLDAAVQLAIIHSPDYRGQLETLYLSALDVSTERFRFVTQFFGGIGTGFLSTGPFRTGNTVGNSVLSTGSSVAANSTGGFTSSINTGTVPNNLRFTRNFSTGGQLLVGFANSFVWQFSGGEQNASLSLLNFNLVQPLLRAGGRAVALEQLTIVERTLLANLRAWQRYRQGFFTNVAIGDFNVTGPQRKGGFSGGTGLTGFSGQGAGGLGGVGAATNFGRAGFGTPTNQAQGGAAGAGFAGGGAGNVGGFVGLLQQLQQLRNTENSLNLQLRTLKLLEANLQAGVIDITQVDVFRQNIETERANLLSAEIGLQNALDTFKRQILGLPPHLPMELDDTMIQQFRLIDPGLRKIEAEVYEFEDRIGATEGAPPIEFFPPAFAEFAALRPLVAERFEVVREDLKKLELALPNRLQHMTDEDRLALRGDQKRLAELLAELETRFDDSAADLDRVRAELNDGNRSRSADSLVALATSLRRLIDELSLVQARARLETISIEPVELDSEVALDIARCARLDWMNNRATLVDTWRLITFNANALKSNLTVSFSGEMGDLTTNFRQAPSFNPSNGVLNASIRFDPPFTRLLERNNYRQQLINYQQDRRTLIQFEDNVNQTLRQDLRTLRQLQTNLEIQRRAVAIAVRRVDKTLEDLNQPPEPVAPGQPAAQLSPTAALNLLTAISDLRNAQNNFMSVWLNYYSERAQFVRDLGVMKIDERGMWVDEPLDATLAPYLDDSGNVDELPPAIPDEWLRDAGFDPRKPLQEQMAESVAAPRANADMNVSRQRLPTPPNAAKNVQPPSRPLPTPTNGQRAARPAASGGPTSAIYRLPPLDQPATSAPPPVVEDSLVRPIGHNAPVRAARAPAR